MGLIHGKQIRNDSVGFIKLYPNQNLDLGNYRLVGVGPGIAGTDGINKTQLESTILSAITANNTNIIAGSGLSGGGYTTASTVTINTNVDNEGIFILSDTISLGDINNEITGNYTFVDDLHIGGNAVIDGNVTILGTATTINTDELYVKDNRIVVNSNATTGTTIPRYSGLDIFRGSGYTDSTSLLWDNNKNSWIIQSPWLDSESGSGNTNDHAILTTGAILSGDAITFTLTNTGDGTDNSLKGNVLYDGVSIKLDTNNKLYADFGSTTADTFVSTAELTGGTTLVLHRNDSVDVLADLSSLHSVDSFLTATTLTPGQILFKGTETFTPITLTGLSTSIGVSNTIETTNSDIEVGGDIIFEVKDNGINDTHIDFGTGPGQVDAAVLPIDSISGLTASTVQEALAELYGHSELKAVPTTNDKNITPDVLTSNTNIQVSSSDLHLTEVPAECSQVMILINGIAYVIGSLTTDSIYFTSDDGTTAVLPCNVTTSTSIHFKTTMLFELDTNDRIDLIYTVLR